MKFITPLTLRNITHRPVVTDMFELASEWSVEHIALAYMGNIDGFQLESGSLFYELLDK